MLLVNLANVDEPSNTVDYLVDGFNDIFVLLVDEDFPDALLQRLQESAVCRELDETLQQRQHRAEAHTNVRHRVHRHPHQVVKQVRLEEVSREQLNDHPAGVYEETPLVTTVAVAKVCK